MSTLTGITSEEYEARLNRQAGPGEKLCCVCSESVGMWVEVTEGTRYPIVDEGCHIDLADQSALDDPRCIPCFIRALES